MCTLTPELAEPRSGFGMYELLGPTAQALDPLLIAAKYRHDGNIGSVSRLERRQATVRTSTIDFQTLLNEFAARYLLGEVALDGLSTKVLAHITVCHKGRDFRRERNIWCS